MQARFAKLDTNGDGAISAEEREAQKGERRAKRGERRGHGLVADPQFGAEATSHERGQKMHILWVDPKSIGQFIHIVFEHLVRPAQGQLVAVPLRDRGVGFHCRRAMSAGAIGFVHGVGGLR